MRCVKFWFLGTSIAILVIINGYWAKRVTALPPMEDIPEEILRTEIITIGRSPIDGKVLTAAEYAQIQTQLQIIPPPKLNSQIREQMFILRLRQILLQIFPFLDI